MSSTPSTSPASRASAVDHGRRSQRRRQRGQRRRPRDRPLRDARRPRRSVDADGARPRRARRWGDCDRETQLFGLAVPGGVVSTTGVAGLTLHGGIGHLRRKHGLSIDSLLSVDIVTADGQMRTASATENEDLFWAVRGAGSNFGVVTSFEFQAHPVGPMVMVGAIFYPFETCAELLPRLARLHGHRARGAELASRSAGASHRASRSRRSITESRSWSSPPCYSGSVEDGEPVVQPLRELAEPLIDLSGPWPWLGLQSGFDALFPKGGSTTGSRARSRADRRGDRRDRGLRRRAGRRRSPTSSSGTTAAR